MGEQKFVLLCETGGVVFERDAEPIELENIWAAWMYDLKSTYDIESEDHLWTVIKVKHCYKMFWEGSSVVPDIKTDKIIVFKYHRLDSTEETGIVCCVDPELLCFEICVNYLYGEFTKTFKAFGIDYNECDLRYAIEAVISCGHDEAIIVNDYVAISYEYNYFSKKI
jgi:hypothetical protein